MIQWSKYCLTHNITGTLVWSIKILCFINFTWLKVEDIKKHKKTESFREINISEAVRSFNNIIRIQIAWQKCKTLFADTLSGCFWCKKGSRLDHDKAIFHQLFLSYKNKWNRVQKIWSIWSASNFFQQKERHSAKCLQLLFLRLSNIENGIFK